MELACESNLFSWWSHQRVLAKSDTSFPLFLFSLPKQTHIDEFYVLSNIHQLWVAFPFFVFVLNLGSIEYGARAKY